VQTLPSQELQDAYEGTLEAKEVMLNLMKRGANRKEIWEGNNEFLQKKLDHSVLSMDY